LLDVLICIIEKKKNTMRLSGVDICENLFKKIQKRFHMFFIMQCCADSKCSKIIF